MNVLMTSLDIYQQPVPETRCQKKQRKDGMRRPSSQPDAQRVPRPAADADKKPPPQGDETAADVAERFTVAAKKKTPKPTAAEANAKTKPASSVRSCSRGWRAELAAMLVMLMVRSASPQRSPDNNARLRVRV